MVTETADEHRPNPWILYARELKFVAACLEGAIDAAEELLLYWLGREWIRWIYTQLDYGNERGPPHLEEVKKVLLEAGYGEKAIETYLGRMLQFFWRSAEHTRIMVDRVNSGATRIGPPWIVGSSSHIEFIDGKFVPVEQHWPIFLTNRPAVTIRVKLFQLHHDDVVTMLRVIGRLPPESKPPPDPTVEPEPEREESRSTREIKPESEIASEPSSPQTAPTAESSAPASEPAPTVESPSPEPTEPWPVKPWTEWEKEIIEAAKRINVFEGDIPPDIASAKLKHDIEHLYKDEAAAKSTPGKRETPRAPPSWNTCDRFLVKVKTLRDHGLWKGLTTSPPSD